MSRRGRLDQLSPVPTWFEHNEVRSQLERSSQIRAELLHEAGHLGAVEVFRPEKGHPGSPQVNLGLLSFG